MTATPASIGLLLLLGVLACTGCNDAKEQCEHARDVAASWRDKSVREAKTTIADPNERAALERQVKREIEQLEAKFVEQCVAAPASTQACVARIDEFSAVQAEGKVAFDRCSSAPVEQRSACLNEAIKPLEAKVSDCMAPLDALFDATFAAAGSK